jgi:hypothetical protein
LGSDDKLRKQRHVQGEALEKDGVMDFVVALLLLASFGVFAAHALDALRPG